MVDDGGPGFVHLHVHSSYSLREGALTVARLTKLAAADRMPALAITDTNNLFAALEFSKTASGDGLQPIIGCQLSIDFEEEAGEERGGRSPQPKKLPALVLLAATAEGYQILSGLVGPGDRIPSELELMARYGCSRMTVSRALSTLSNAGLLQRRRRAGTVVAQRRTESMVLDVPDLLAVL